MAPKHILEMMNELYKTMLESDGDLMRQGVERLYNMLVQMDVENEIGAGRYERTDDRRNRLNGYRERPLDTTVGRIDVKIPKLRTGSYMPPFLEPRRMVDKALVNVIQEAYINGVSTRKVDNLVESLGIACDKSKVSRFTAELSAVVEAFRNRPLSEKEYPYIYVDATFPKVRESGQVVSMALMIAMAVNRNGDREVLGFELGLSEDGEMWKAFLQSLVDRGLSGVKLVISDAHAGLKKAISEVFIGAGWQRCTVHFMRNVLCQVPQKQKSMVAAIVRTIFTAENRDEAKAQLRNVVDQLAPRFPKAMQIVEDAEDEVLAFFNYPARHHKSIYSSNVLERLNKEIRRRFNVVSVFPDRDAVIRLGGAVLMEQHDEWICCEKRYLPMDSINELYAQPLQLEAA